VRVLAITQMFPNAAEPLAAPFNRQQLVALRELCEVEVIAPLPWFPFAGAAARWSAAGRRGGVPRRERTDGLDVSHPRALYIPRVARGSAAALYAASVLPETLRRRGRVDVVLASWAYPDGCAAIALARLLGVPAAVKLHGSDMNVIAELPGPRRVLRWLLPRAAAVIAVSRQLAERAAALGVDPSRVALVYNGVDGELFRPADRAAARAELGLRPELRWLLYVGHLKRAKGAHDLVTAFGAIAAANPDLGLAIVGDGEGRSACEQLAATLGDRVRVAGARPLAEVPRWIAACDALVLPSWNEGTPNAVLEALACGRRVVASSVGGIPDLITSELVGELVPPRQPELLAPALVRAARTDYDPVAVAAAGARGDWRQSARRLHAVLERAVASADGAAVSGG
jgi:glycosyltransferase involved in cell wall biosynthesis